MVYASDLKPLDVPSFRIRDINASLTLVLIKKALEDYNDENYGYPVRFDLDQVKSGGFFNSTLEDCLTIINFQHEGDYFKYCITLRRQGKMAVVTMTYYGQSALTGQRGKQQEREANGSLGGIILNLFNRVDESQYDAEYQYYDAIESMYEDFLRSCIDSE